MKVPFTFSLFGALMGLGAGTAIGSALTSDTISEDARSYLNRALDILQNNSIKRATTDWPSFRTTVFAQAPHAKTAGDTYPAIRFALTQLGDHSAILMTPAATVDWVAPRDSGTLATPSSPAQSPPLPHGELIEGFGYLAVPGLSAGNIEAGTAFADTIANAISHLDAASPRGWIVDLRENTGGNMWPMLAGLGLLAGEGDVGGFVDPYGKKTAWWYRKGVAGSVDWPAAKMSETPHQLRQPAAPVAVLIGPKTTSSGEGIVVSFVGRPATRTFGEPTGGNSNVIATFALSDGAALFLTSAIFTDRTGKTYGGAIVPDVAVPMTPSNSLTVSTDPVVRSATAWLKSQSQSR